MQFLHLKAFVHSVGKDFLKPFSFITASLNLQAYFIQLFTEKSETTVGWQRQILKTFLLPIRSCLKRQEKGVSLVTVKGRAAKMKEQMDCAIKMQKEDLHF